MNVFHSECRKYSRFSQIYKNTQIQKSYDFFGIKFKNVMTFSELVRLLCRLLPCIPQSLRGSQLLHFTNSLPASPYSNSSSLRTPSRLRRTPSLKRGRVRGTACGGGVPKRGRVRGTACGGGVHKRGRARGTAPTEEEFVVAESSRFASVIPMITGTVEFHSLNLVVFWK